MNKSITFAICIAGAAFHQGCAIPQAALDQANKSVILSQKLTVELKKLKAEQDANAVRRTNAIRDMRERQEKFGVDLGNNVDIVKNTPKGKLFAELKEDSDARAKRQADSDATMAALNAKLATFLSSEGDSTKAIAAVAKEEAQLAEPRSADERKALIESIAKSIYAAQSAAPAASAASAAAPAASAAKPGGAASAVAPKPAASAPK